MFYIISDQSWLSENELFSIEPDQPGEKQKQNLHLQSHQLSIHLLPTSRVRSSQAIQLVPKEVLKKKAKIVKGLGMLKTEENHGSKNIANMVN